jgi:hypothetical protein
MGLTRVSGDILQTPLNVGVVTATRIDSDINSTGVSTFSTLKVGASVDISGGIVTAPTFSGNLTGNVTGNATGLSGTPNIVVGSITAASAVVTGNVSVAGTVTYEDTTNVDSIGIVTARTGIHILTGSLGIGTDSPATSIDASQETDAIALPQGTTAQRPSGNNPYIRYNTTNSALEFYNGTDWVEIISDYFPQGSVILG